MLDPDLRLALVEPKSWWTLAAFVACILALVALVPGVREFFSLDVRRAALFFLPTLILGLAVGTLEKRRKLSLAAFGVLALIGSALFQWFAWCMVTLAELPGATVMAALPILLAAYHGHAFRCGPRYPFVSIGTVVGAVAAQPFASGSDHFGILLIGPLIAIAAALTLGQNAMSSARAGEERNALREALSAQLLSERTDQAAQLSRLIMNLRTSNHDAGSAISGALVNMELLLRKLEKLDFGSENEEVVAITSDVVSSLGTLHALIDEARKHGQREALDAEKIDVERIVERVMRELSARFPHLQFRSELDLVKSSAELVGGPVVLERILRNLLANASEGRGGGSSSTVELNCAWNGRELVLRVQDNGPGFTDEQLARGVGRLETTKAWGTGLGLYTVDKLCRSQGGELRLSNGPTGGADVRAILRPRASRAE